MIYTTLSLIPFVVLIAAWIYEKSDHNVINRNRKLIRERGVLNQAEWDEVLAAIEKEQMNAYYAQQLKLKTELRKKAAKATKMIAVCCLLLMVTACVSNPAKTTPFFKTGATADDKAMAEAKCRMGQANLPSEQTPNNAITNMNPNMTRAEQFYEDCMLSQGYKRR